MEIRCAQPAGALWRLYFETGHWYRDFLIDRMTGSGRTRKYGFSQTGSSSAQVVPPVNPYIRSMVAQHEAAAAERLAVTRERVLVELKKAIDVAREQRNPAAVIARWREIAKI